MGEVDGDAALLLSELEVEPADLRAGVEGSADAFELYGGCERHPRPEEHLDVFAGQDVHGFTGFVPPPVS